MAITNATTPLRIKAITVGGSEYAIEAQHFVAASTLTTPTEWKNYIDSAISSQAKIQIVEASWNTGKTAPATTASADTLGKIYICKNEGTVSGTFTEFITIDQGSSKPAAERYIWEKIGTTATDLSDYAKKGSYTSGGSGELTANNGKTGITISSSGGHDAAATLTGTYKLVGDATGSAGGTGTSANTGDGGNFSVTPTFTGTAATLTGTVTGTTIKSIEYTPAGSISGNQEVSGHSHQVNVSSTTKSVVTSATIGGANDHSHTVTTHKHGDDVNASVITAFNGGSLGGTTTFNTNAIKSIGGTVNYGFSASTSKIMTAATVSNTGVLSWTEATAGTSDAHTGTAAGTGTVTLTAATISYSGVTAAGTKSAETLTSSSAGAHSHSFNPTAATITYVTGATTSAGGGFTINGSNFSFAGTKATLTPEINAAGSVTIAYTPAGSVSAVSVGSHKHSYTKPADHTHSVSTSDATITVGGVAKVANHTHTVNDNGHTHTINSHTHSVTI